MYIYTYIQKKYNALFLSFYRKDRSFNTELYETHFTHLARARGVTLPPYLSALHNISILLVNSHPSFTPAQSLPPNVVEIAGFHIEEETPVLPKVNLI